MGSCFGAYSSGSERDKVDFGNSLGQQYAYAVAYNGGSTYDILATGYSRDQAGWQHVVCRVDTTDSTEANRWRFYINGELDSCKY